MNKYTGLELLASEMEDGIQLTKCQQCGCMDGALNTFAQQLHDIAGSEATELARNVTEWKVQMKPVRYTCLGCEHCYPAVAENAFSQAFPETALPPALTCGFQTIEGVWPAVLGEYFVLDKTAPVAVATLASVQLVEELSNLKPAGLAMVGKLETENIGIDKVVKNVISNPAIRTIIVAGVEPKDHQSGSALLALAQNGVDEKNQVIGSAAKRPVLRNVTRAEIDTFRHQVQMVDLRGCEDSADITAHVAELASSIATACSCAGDCVDENISSAATAQPALHTINLHDEPKLVEACSDPTCACHADTSSSPEIVVAVDTGRSIPMDKAGYFVVLPVTGRGVINVEHYGYDNTLLHVIEGTTARSLYLAIIDQGWIGELSHAAYLGKELTKAELSLRLGFKYVQDGV